VALGDKENKKRMQQTHAAVNEVTPRSYNALHGAQK
jgi:hypothetical protein